ncbi:MAG: rhomboid family intramembrane serine protease [Prevotellaceae bacterium]|jgi:membrane associated rhomboid family serine protease|nr:rhomboid family intramembrane serine protease [Prevotellaceae bacterium]
MLTPHNLLALLSVGATILAFNNSATFHKLTLRPYLVVRDGSQAYRVVTHAFIHADWMHLLFNMIALWSFGGAAVAYLHQVAEAPNTHFYCLYFGAILFSSLPDLVKRRNNPGYASVGASGAISAVIFFTMLFNPWHIMYVFFIPCPGIIFGVLYLIYSGYMSRKGGSIINHDAHFYGALFGLLYPLFVVPEIYSFFLSQLFHPHF